MNLINEATVQAQVNNAIEFAKLDKFESAFNSLSKALDCSQRAEDEMYLIDAGHACVTLAQEQYRVQLKQLNAFLDWCVLRQEYPNRRATVVVWCEVNWPEASDKNITFLHSMAANNLVYTPV